MVLTQLLFDGEIETQLEVSIPLWFLRNDLVEAEKEYWNTSFPYHYGSYATESMKWLFYYVLLFPYHYGSYATRHFLKWVTPYRRVSIPLWFLRNRLHIYVPGKYQLLFPYHYGSYATYRFEKEFFFFAAFPYHYGSYATYGRESWSIAPTRRFHTTMVLTQPLKCQGRQERYVQVSIPLWFI